MTRISTFQVAGILVAALMCFSEVCYADNTTNTGPKTPEATTNGPTTTGESTTTTAINLTTTGPKTTAGNMTTAFSDITATASTMTITGPTTTASNMTTIGPTTTAGNMTTAFSDITTTASNMTTPASNMTTTGPTTTASNMTTAVSNITTTASNMTTAVSNMTTESGTTSTTTSVTSGGTTPAPEARWQVKDKNGKLCMIMYFDGTITDVISGVTRQIPSDASTSRSNCSSSSYSAFVLEFNTIFTKWGIVLNFTTRGDSFMLHTLSASRSTLGTPLSSSVTLDFPDVPLGDYYICSHFNYSIGYFQLNLTNPLLQPFVQKPEGGNNLGQPYVCRHGHSNSDGDSDIDIDYIIGIVAGVIISICVASGLATCTCCFCCNSD